MRRAAPFPRRLVNLAAEYVATMAVPYSVLEMIDHVVYTRIMTMALDAISRFRRRS